MWRHSHFLDLVPWDCESSVRVCVHRKLNHDRLMFILFHAEGILQILSSVFQTLNSCHSQLNVNTESATVSSATWMYYDNWVLDSTTVPINSNVCKYCIARMNGKTRNSHSAYTNMDDPFKKGVVCDHLNPWIVILLLVFRNHSVSWFYQLSVSENHKRKMADGWRTSVSLKLVVRLWFSDSGLNWEKPHTLWSAPFKVHYYFNPQTTSEVYSTWNRRCNIRNVELTMTSFLCLE